MSVDLYIKELISSEDCVIIPKLGGFIANYKDSQIIESSVITLLPPRKKMLFNSNLNVDDGILIKYISDEESISYAEAKQEVENFVNKCQNALTEDGFFEIEDLGSLRINSSKKIQFEPISEFGEMIPESFGLPEIKLANTQPINEPISGPTEKRVSTFKHQKLIRRAIFATPILLGLAIIPSHFYNQVQESSIISLGDTTNKIEEYRQMIQNNASTEVANLEIASIETPKDSVANVVKQANIETPIENIEKEHFYIISGSFKNVKNANKLANELQQLGYNAEIVETKYMVRVATAKFDTKDEAVQSLAKLRNENKLFADSWIFTK